MDLLTRKAMRELGDVVGLRSPDVSAVASCSPPPLTLLPLIAADAFAADAVAAPAAWLPPLLPLAARKGVRVDPDLSVGDAASVAGTNLEAVFEGEVDPAGDPQQPAGGNGVLGLPKPNADRLHTVITMQDLLIGHEQQVNAVAFSLHDNSFASGGYDNAIIVWDLETWEPRRRIVDHTQPVTSVAWNPQQAQILASASGDETILVWRRGDCGGRGCMDGSARFAPSCPSAVLPCMGTRFTTRRPATAWPGWRVTRTGSRPSAGTRRTGACSHRRATT